jgi:2-polyprenyl-3-methyl-5-hydroxy-6-metoxy-1,4-benzoquinol methylase
MDNYRIACSDYSQYALATGEKDQERLTILNEIYNPYSAQFLENCEIQEDAKILELGCGLGLMSQVLAGAVKRGGFVLATDINQEQLQIAKNLLPQNSFSNIEFRQLSAFKIDELNESFDVIYARLLLVHLKEPLKLIPKIKMILKPGGKLIIEDLTSNLSLRSSSPTEGMTILHHLDQLQNELQGSDDLYFASLPQYLEKEGFQIHSIQKVQPQLDTPRKRKSVVFHLSSLKEALLGAGKITLEGYHTMLQKVIELEQNSAIIIHYYELGQLCAIYE